MTKHWPSLYQPFVLTLAIVCAAGEVAAQENNLGPNALLPQLDRKHASRLVIVQQPPEYPAVARVNYIQGRVELEITVNAQGNVDSAHVLAGNAMLAQSALETSRRWIYRPLSTPEGPAGFRTTVMVRFDLQMDSLNDVQLTPRQAERDFLRQVKPPQVTKSPEGVPPGDVLHLRLLVDDQGQVVDMDVSPQSKAQLESANETLRGWTFRPARWGNMPIASYLNVDVPLTTPSVAEAAVKSGGR